MVRLFKKKIQRKKKKANIRISPVWSVIGLNKQNEAHIKGHKNGPV